MRGILAGLVLVVMCAAAQADCGGEFKHWLDGLHGQAQEAGIGRAALGLIGAIRWNARVLDRDRSQRVFAQDWQTFAGRMVNAHRLKAGAARLARLAAVFAQAQQSFGVPGPVIAAFWGLETMGCWAPRRARRSVRSNCGAGSRRMPGRPRGCSRY